MNRYTKLAADGTDLPADTTGHLAVRVDNDLLARPIIWTAHRSKDRMTWKAAAKWAEKLDINGWSWRLPTVEEAFLLCDRTRTAEPMVDPAYFPDCEGEWIWTSTEDKTPPRATRGSSASTAATRTGAEWAFTASCARSAPVSSRPFGITQGQQYEIRTQGVCAAQSSPQTHSPQSFHAY